MGIIKKLFGKKEIETIMENLVEGSPEIKSLIFGEGKSYNELCKDGTIIYDVNGISDAFEKYAPEAEKCILIGEERDNVVMLHVLCCHSCWSMDDMKQRPFKLCETIFDAVHAKVSLKSKLLKFGAMKFMTMNEIASGITLLFGTEDFYDEGVENPFAAMDKLNSEFMKRICAKAAVREFLGEEGDAAELCESGKISTYTSLGEGKKCICLNYDYDDGISITLSCFGNDADVVKAAADAAEDAILSVPGTTQLAPCEVKENEGIVFTMSLFEADYNEASLSESVEPVKPVKKAAVMDGCISNMNFYMDNDAHAWFIQNNPDGLSFNSGDDFTMDIIDQPFSCRMTSEENRISTKVYLRGMVGVYEGKEPDLAMDIVRDGDEIKPENVKASSMIGGNQAETIMHFVNGAVSLRNYVLANVDKSEFEGLDIKHEGILVKIKNGKPVFTRVAGRKRPAMATLGLFGGVEMSRTYEDEMLEHMFDEDKDFETVLEDAEEGDEFAMQNAAMTYLNGDEDNDIEPDAEKAFYWFGKLADAGDATAMFNIGLFYAKGFATERNLEKAAEWMEKAAAEGDEDAEALVPKYRQAAADIAAADTGDAEAAVRLAGFYMEIARSLDQAGTGNDFAESLKWAFKATENGNAKGYWFIGLSYLHGRGVETDGKKAVEFFRKGAELGNLECMHNLACEYINGVNVEEDAVKGFELTKAAAEQGYGLAMRDLGACYQFAKGCTGNMEKALEWYEKAAEILHDPDLDLRVEGFRKMREVDETWGDDYEDEPVELDPQKIIQDIFDYERELYESGFMADEPFEEDSIARVAAKADEGDMRAVMLIGKLMLLSDDGEE